jgi:tRNA A-37 threonylcarbamoyl transferase component Bud32
VIQKLEILRIRFAKSWRQQDAKGYKLKNCSRGTNGYKMYIFPLFFSLLSFCLADSDLKNYVESNLPQASNVQHLKWQDQFYWVKKADSNKGWWSCTGKKIVSFLVPDKIIAPTTICNQTILATEARRLTECNKKQGACARLIMQGDDWILVSDAGKSFEYFLRDLPVEQRLPHIMRGLEAVLTLHDHHMVHGRASVKDLTLTSQNQFLFIDLAEDPESWMSYDEARTRDLINYFMTTVAFLKTDKTLEDHYTALFIKAFPQDLKPLLHRVIDKTKWLGKIAYAVQWFAGKDTVKFTHAHQLLHKQLKEEKLDR